MAALTIERKTPKLGQDALPSYTTNAGVNMEAAAKCFAGGMVGRNAAGNATAAAAASIAVLGVAESTIDNTAGIAGALTIAPRIGVFQFNNSASADLIAVANVGQDCYVVDDNTVALTNSNNTRCRAGVIVGVDATGAGGVWVLVGPIGVQGAQTQRLTATLIAGVATINTGIFVNASSQVFVQVLTPAGTAGFGYKAVVTTPGGPGVGVVTITAISTTGTTVGTDTSVLNVLIVG